GRAVAAAFVRGAVTELGPFFDTGGEPVDEPRWTTAADADELSAVRDPGSGTLHVFAARRGRPGARGGRLVAERVIGREGETVARWDGGGRGFALSTAPDRLRGGALALFRADAGWRLVHVAADGPLAARDVVALDALPAEPAGPLASNETEALIPLADGSLAYVPLALSTVRVVEPVDDAPVEAMRVVLRPGGSAGGLLYVRRDAGGAVLRYQPLICNR
ncbi:MAG TPA: hypothetical protein RMH99_09340, partial [Sandaracinaceae bacterium LLY-WYZ-13_1]|nr:hypothetical protein [Sandaracinaceae bacterium LLY-WYZ-13_1]